MPSSPTKKLDETSEECEMEKPIPSPKEHAQTKAVSGDEEMQSNEGDDSSHDSSDSEDYAPASDEASSNSNDSDDELSALEEEEGIKISSSVCGGSKFYKLKFDDIEKKRKEFLSKLKSKEADEESTSSFEEVEEEDSSKAEPMSDQISKAQFSGYRSFMMNLRKCTYTSDEDDDFNPMYCGETLSDDEDIESDEENTESEPEVESLAEKNRKTGETLKCIKMMKNYLTIPPEGDSNEDTTSSENAMEQ